MTSIGHPIIVLVQITLEFYQKKKSRWMFKPEEIPWEIWTIKIEQMQLSSENGEERMIRCVRLKTPLPSF
jgi:hypothetical protein